MKALTIIILFLSHQLCGQISTSLGSTRWSESEINLQDHFLKPFDRNLKYAHSKWNFGVSYQNDRHLFSVDVSRFRKYRVEYSTSISSVSGGGSSPIYYYSKSFRSQVSYTYVGTKIGYAYTFEGTSPFNNKWKTLIEVGVFGGVDFLTAYDEMNHYTREKASNNSNMSQQMVVTMDEESTDEFKGVSMRKAPIYVGLYFARRLIIGPVFIRGAVSYGRLNYGTTNYVRVTPLNSSYSENNSQVLPEPQKKRFFSTDISIGYTFGMKTKRKLDPTT